MHNGIISSIYFNEMNFMNTLTGTPVENGSYLYIEDLFYYDGPLLSLFKNEADELHLVLWCDNDETVNRWMRFKLSEDNYKAYLKSEISLKDIILKQEHVTFYEIFAKCEQHLFEERNFIQVDVKNIPEDYLPTDQSFYKE